MRRRAAEQYQNQRPARATDEKAKYRPGLDPLEAEAHIGEIRALNHAEVTQLKKWVKRLLRKPNLSDTERNALLMWNANLTLDTLPGMVQQEFQRDFWAWLLGRGKQKDHDATPWGRQALTGDAEVAKYVDMFVEKRHEFGLKLELMKHRVPQGINQAYLYYKFIVRGSTDFLQDWEIFLKQFDEARRPPFNQWHRDPKDYPYPHEVAPYGDARAIVPAEARTRQRENFAAGFPANENPPSPRPPGAPGGGSGGGPAPPPPPPPPPPADDSMEEASDMEVDNDGYDPVIDEPPTPDGRAAAALEAVDDLRGEMNHLENLLREFDEDVRGRGVPMDTDDEEARARLADEIEATRAEIERQGGLAREQRAIIERNAERRHAELLDALDGLSNASKDQTAVLNKAVQAFEQANVANGRRLAELEQNQARNYGDTDAQLKELRELSASCKEIAELARKAAAEKPDPRQLNEIKVTLDQQALADTVAAFREANGDTVKALDGLSRRNREMQEESLRELTATLDAHEKGLQRVFEHAAEQNQEAIAREMSDAIKSVTEKLAGNVPPELIQKLRETEKRQGDQIAEQAGVIAKLHDKIRLLEARPEMPVLDDIIGPVIEQHEQELGRLRRDLMAENAELLRRYANLAAETEALRAQRAVVQVALNQEPTPAAAEKVVEAQDLAARKAQNVAESEKAADITIHQLETTIANAAAVSKRVGKEQDKAEKKTRQYAVRQKNFLTPLVRKLSKLQAQSFLQTLGQSAVAEAERAEEEQRLQALIAEAEEAAQVAEEALAETENEAGLEAVQQQEQEDEKEKEEILRAEAEIAQQQAEMEQARAAGAAEEALAAQQLALDEKKAAAEVRRNAPRAARPAPGVFKGQQAPSKRGSEAPVKSSQLARVVRGGGGGHAAPSAPAKGYAREVPKEKEEAAPEEEPGVEVVTKRAPEEGALKEERMRRFKAAGKGYVIELANVAEEIMGRWDEYHQVAKEAHTEEEMAVFPPRAQVNDINAVDFAAIARLMQSAWNKFGIVEAASEVRPTKHRKGRARRGGAEEIV